MRRFSAQKLSSLLRFPCIRSYILYLKGQIVNVTVTHIEATPLRVSLHLYRYLTTLGKKSSNYVAPQIEKYQ